MPVTISLTSIPPRIDRVYLCIESLLDQSFKPDHLILWLTPAHFGYSRPEEAERALPDSLIRLRRRGLSIRWTEDLRSYRKLLPTLKIYPHHIIVTADDDTLYPRTWLERLYARHRQYPDCIVCYRGKSMKKQGAARLAPYEAWEEYHATAPGFDLFPTGKDGILYPPSSLHPEIFNAARFMRLAPTNDDVWFKAMSLLQGTRCAKIAPRHQSFPVIPGTHKSALYRINLGMRKNDTYLEDVFRAYDLFDLIRT